jgi:hypothetical protein
VFTDLLREQAALIASVDAALVRDTESFDLDWYEGFFGQALPGRVRVIGSLSSGENNYGSHVVVDGVRTTVAVLGAGVGSNGATRFADVSILVHEVGHDFVNPLLEAHRAELEGVGKRLFAPVAGPMTRRAYGDWATVLNESVLRACVVRYLAAHGGDVQLELSYQRQAGFPWTRILARSLAAYEADRARWPTFADYVPELVTAVDASATYAVVRRITVARNGDDDARGSRVCASPSDWDREGAQRGAALDSFGDDEGLAQRGSIRVEHLDPRARRHLLGRDVREVHGHEPCPLRAVTVAPDRLDRHEVTAIRAPSDTSRRAGGGHDGEVGAEAALPPAAPGPGPV